LMAFPVGRALPPGRTHRGEGRRAAASICEAVPAEDLAEVCTEYFEVMCGAHGAPPVECVRAGV